MILFFHVICLLARHLVSNISKSLSKTVFSDDDEEDNLKSILPDFVQNKEYVKHPIYKNGILKFFPPVYVQRYETVALILKDPVWKTKISKVVDFGCGELGFFMYLKNNENVTEILEVDIDSELLERCAHKAAPLTCDYLMNKRDHPLDVYILAGSVADYDDLLLGSDAIVGIELIEHLNEEVFKNMPYNIFHKIKPKLVIFTTPNADFNSLFPNFQNMRHEDHKFEWTRREFFNWTQDIIKLYPDYSARFYGIGAGPEGTENLGCCSQMVVFQRSEDTESFSSARDQSEGINNYKLIKHYKYPVHVDTRTAEEKIVHEIQCQVSYFNTLPTYYNYENNESEIPLCLLKEYVADLCPDDEEFRNILEKNGMLLREKNMSWFLVSPDTESSSSDQKFKDDNWLNDDITENFCDHEDPFLDVGSSWDDEIHLGNGTNLKSIRSLEDLRGNITYQNEVFGNIQKENIPIIKDEVELPPFNHNDMVKQISPAKGVCINSCNSNNKNSNNSINNRNNNSNDDDNDVGDNSSMKNKSGNNNSNSDGDGNEVKRSNMGKSKIPHKKNDSKEDKHSPVRNFGKTSLSCKSRNTGPCHFNLGKLSKEAVVMKDWENEKRVHEKDSSLNRLNLMPKT